MGGSRPASSKRWRAMPCANSMTRRSAGSRGGCPSAPTACCAAPRSPPRRWRSHSSAGAGTIVCSPRTCCLISPSARRPRSCPSANWPTSDLYANSAWSHCSAMFSAFPAGLWIPRSRSAPRNFRTPSPAMSRSIRPSFAETFASMRTVLPSPSTSITCRCRSPAARHAGLKQGCPGPGAAKASPGIRCWTGEAFSEGGKPGHDASLDAFPPSMRPGLAAAEREIVGIGDRTAHRFLRLDHLVGDALALAIGDGFLLAVEVQRDLLLHVAGRGPAHQRLDRARLLGLVVELPFLGLRPAGLHRVLGGLENACGHGWSGPLVRLFVRFRCVTVAVGGNRGHSIETPFGN